MNRLPLWLALLFALAMGASALAADQEASAAKKPASPDGKAYPADPKMPPFTLPDPLLTTDGGKITTAEGWKSLRRAEVLELFRKHVYGRVPATKYETRYRVVHEDPRAIGGTATLKEVAIEITRGAKAITINLVLFVPLGLFLGALLTRDAVDAS